MNWSYITIQVSINLVIFALISYFFAMTHRSAKDEGSPTLRRYHQRLSKKWDRVSIVFFLLVFLAFAFLYFRIGLPANKDP